MHKTKLVALLLAVVMIVSMIIPGVSAAAVACPAHTEVAEWTEVAEGTWTGGVIAEGHYKLTGNQNITSALTVAGNVCIDLAGYNITAGANKDNNYRVCEVTGVLTITDSAETDGVISGGHMETKPDVDVHVYGGNILVTGGKLNLYGGVISGGYMKAPSYMYHIYGGNIGLLEGAELNIYGGAVKDGKIEMPQQATYYHGGGNIYADASSVNIYGGTVSGGDVTARYGSGSTNARKAYGVGGNIAVVGGTFYMEDGLVDGGNLDVRCNATSTTVVGSTAHAHGGNVYCIDSTVTIKGNAVISNGTLSGEALSANPSVDASLEAHGGNLYIKNCTSAEIRGNAQILNGEVVNDKTSARGGNLYVSTGTVTMSENAVLSGGTCPTKNARGGNAFVLGTFNINGGIISDGSAGWGANLMLQSGATINLNGATISGGVGDSSVLIQRGTFNMNGGSIADPEGDFEALSVQGTNDSNGGKAYINAGVVGDIYTNRASEVHVAAGATIGKMEKEHTSTIELADGVTMLYNPALAELEGFDAYVMDKSTGTTKYAVYADITDALEAAQSGNTVSLMRDVTTDEVLVPAGVTLNLYGSDLTANTVSATAAGAQIKDDRLSQNGGGKLVCSDVAVSEDNVAAPIYYGGMYHFQKFAIAEQTVGNVYTFYIADTADTVLLDEAWANGSDGTGIALVVTATWTENSQAKYKEFVVDSDLVEQYVADWDNKMFKFTVTSDLTGIEDLAFTARVAVA